MGRLTDTQRDVRLVGPYVDRAPTWIRLLGIGASTVGLLLALLHPDRPSAPLSTVDTVAYMDPFTTASYTVAAAHANHQRAICVLRAGVWEEHRPDAARFAAALHGAVADGGGRWLDIRAWPDLAEPLGDRLDLCAGKGFDGVLFVDMDGWAQRSGFPLTRSDQLRFNTEVVREALRYGLRVTIESTQQTPIPPNLA